MKLEVEYIKTEKIKPYANNAKIHTAEQIDQIKESIKEFGFNDPVAVWKDNEIIEGHGRLLAAIELGVDELPVIRLDELSDEQRRAYMLAHNQITMNTGYDYSILDIELEEISIDMERFGFDTGEFSDKDLEDFFVDAEPKEKEPKKVQCPHCGEWFEP